MRFLVLIKTLPSLHGHEADKELRTVVGPHIPKIMATGKVAEAGFLTDRRGAFLLIEAGSGIDLYRVLGPEIYSNFEVEAHPVAPLEEGARAFEEWAQEGR